MKGILLLLVGVVAGFAIAHTVSKTSGGERFFADVDSKAREFASAVVDGYQAREAELLAAVAGADDASSDRTRSR